MNLSTRIEKVEEWLVTQQPTPKPASIRNKLIQIREQAEAFEAAHAKLKNQHLVLKNTAEHEKAELAKAHAKLEEKYSDLQNEHAALEQNHDELVSQHSSLKVLETRRKVARRLQINVIRPGGPIAGTTGVPGIPG